MTPNICACGADITQLGDGAKECYPCRITSKVDRECIGCGDNHRRRFAQYCDPCAGANYAFSEFGSGRYIAAGIVAIARNRGELVSPKRFKCVDCGGPASCYDHRDYNRALVVEPVCKGCNVRRGSAVPREWTFSEFMEWANTRAHVMTLLGRIGPESIEKLALLHFDSFDSQPQSSPPSEGSASPIEMTSGCDAVTGGA